MEYLDINFQILKRNRYLRMKVSVYETTKEIKTSLAHRIGKTADDLGIIVDGTLMDNDVIVQSWNILQNKRAYIFFYQATSGRTQHYTTILKSKQEEIASLKAANDIVMLKYQSLLHSMESISSSVLEEYDILKALVYIWNKSIFYYKALDFIKEDVQHFAIFS